MLLPLQVVCSKLASKARLFLLHYKLLETRYKKTQALMGATRLASGQIQEKSPRQNEITENALMPRRETRRPH